MSVTLHQPVAGMDAGATYSGPMERWLVVNGYASDGAKTDKADVTGVLEDENPTLADHREAPGEDFEVLGQKLEPKAKPVETGEREAAPLPAPRNTVLGVEEDPEVTAANAPLQEVKKSSGRKAKVQEVAEAAAEEAAGNSEHSVEEPRENVPGAQHGVDGNTTDK